MLAKGVDKGLAFLSRLKEKNRNTGKGETETKSDGADKTWNPPGNGRRSEIGKWEREIPP